jgi:hypothetical protein
VLINLIPKDKAQLISLLHKQPTTNVIDITEVKTYAVAEKIRLLKR